MLLYGKFLPHIAIYIGCNVHYVRRHYKSNTTIIFDGYNQTTAINSMEQKRKAMITKSSADIEVMLDATTTTTQSQFLANPYNKAQLIKIMSTALMSHDADVVQAEADADVTIAITALEDASENDEECVSVVSRDTDVLVILIARLDDRRNTVLIQPQPGKADRTYDLYKISGELGHSVKSSWHYMRSLAVIRQAHPSEMGKRTYHHLCETAEASGGACTYSARLRGCTRKPGKR